MKKWFLPFVMGALLVFSSMPAHAAGEKTFLYDTNLRIVFGFGQGKQTVREEEFGKFLMEVVTPTFKEGYCVLEARGQWVHPTRGVTREKNSLIFVDIQDGEEADAKVEKVVNDYLRRFPNSNASVYVVKTPGISAKIYF